MPVFPSSALSKSNLRLLLAQLEQADRADLKSAKLQAAKQWAMMAGLVNERGLTTEGRLVITKDPYLETTVTDWLIHFYLSNSNQSLWNYFVYQFLPDHSEFVQVDLIEDVTKSFVLESPQKLQKAIQALLKTYVDPQSIANLHFLTQDQKSYSTGNSDLSNVYTTGYLLAKVWEQEFSARTAILVDELLDLQRSFQSLLGINREQLRQQLGILAKCEIVERRSAKPSLAGTKPETVEDQASSYQIYRCWNSAEELLEKAYESDKATPNRPLIQVLDDTDEVPDFSQFLEWSSELLSLASGSNRMTNLAS